MIKKKSIFSTFWFKEVLDLNVPFGGNLAQKEHKSGIPVPALVYDQSRLPHVRAVC